MKKNKMITWKIIIVNILLLLFFLCVIDFLLYKSANDKYVSICLNNRYGLMDENCSSLPYFQKLRTFQDCYAEKDLYDGMFLKAFTSFRQTENIESDKPSIIIFGCSFAAGAYLKDNQTISYKLSKYFDRPIYNKAMGACGIQHMLYQLSQDDFESTVKKPAYVIYVFMPDHVHRLYKKKFGMFFQFPRDNMAYLNYEYKHNQLKEVKPRFLWLQNNHIVPKIQAMIMVQKLKNKDKSFDFMKLHFIESKKILDKKFPNTKFIILKYYSNNWNNYPSIESVLDSPRWKELEDLGFIITDTYALTGKDLSRDEYILPDTHPNEKAWDEIVPKLAEFLNNIK